jgi:hypothetical protein
MCTSLQIQVQAKHQVVEVELHKQHDTNNIADMDVVVGLR